MKVTITTISERQHARFIYTKDKNKWQNNLIYKNIDTLKKARQFASCFIYKNQYTLCYAICHEMFEVIIYVQKA